MPVYILREPAAKTVKQKEQKVSTTLFQLLVHSLLASVGCAKWNVDGLNGLLGINTVFSIVASLSHQK